jgi:glutathione S-transferase
VVLDYASTMKGADYLAINPMGKVPALKHGDVVVTEAAAICAYLADAFPQADLAPERTSKLRAPYYRWMFYAAGPVEAASSNKAMGWEAPPERQRMFGYGNFETVQDVLENAVSKTPYLLGDKFSAADVYVGSHIGFGMQFGQLEKRPAFESYFARISSRPAAVRANQLDNDLIAAAAKK